MRFMTITIFAALLLAGCSSDSENLRCPAAAVLAPTSVLTVFRDGAPSDPSGELFTVWMSNVTTDCTAEKDSRSTDSTVTIKFQAKRAPSAEAANYKVPYFVTVTQGGDQILTKKLFLAHFSFAPGEATTSFEDTIASTVIKITRGNKVGSYEILTGLQLTGEQLEYNRKMSHYAP